MSNKIKLIAITGTRLSGKDTFFNLLKENNKRFLPVSFADALKRITKDISLALFGKSIKDLTPEQKEIMRPIWIYVGTKAREININCWVETVTDFIKESVDSDHYIPVIIDMRFKSEFDYFKKIYGDSMLLVNITRDGAPEPTDEEKINGPEVAKLADFHLAWPTNPDFTLIKPMVLDFYNKFIKTS